MTQVDLLRPQPITRSADHRYTYNGITYPGVTSILGVLDKSGPLMAWAARETAEAAVRFASKPTDVGDELFGKSTLEYMLETVGEAGTIKALTERSGWKRDSAAQLGTEVHRIADLVNNGLEPPQMDDITRTRVNHYSEWWRGSGWRLRASEAMLIEDDLGYGGTMDLLCYDEDGKTVLADIKTGEKGVYREAILQLTLYGMAKRIQTDKGIFAMPVADRYALLHVTSKGCRVIEINVGQRERVAALACINLYEWHEATKGVRL